MAEWLGTGLQNLLRRFESVHDLTEGDERDGAWRGSSGEVPSEAKVTNETERGEAAPAKFYSFAVIVFIWQAIVRRGCISIHPFFYLFRIKLFCIFAFRFSLHPFWVRIYNLANLELSDSYLLAAEGYVFVPRIC